MPFFFGGIEPNCLVLEPFRYSHKFPVDNYKYHFENKGSDKQKDLFYSDKPLFTNMGDGDPPRKPNFKSNFYAQLQSISLEDLLNIILWLLEQINLGNLQAQDCVIELLNSLHTQISSGQSVSQHFQEHLSLFVNLIYQNRNLFELVKTWFGA